MEVKMPETRVVCVVGARYKSLQGAKMFAVLHFGYPLFFRSLIPLPLQPRGR